MIHRFVDLLRATVQLVPFVLADETTVLGSPFFGQAVWAVTSAGQDLSIISTRVDDINEANMMDAEPSPDSTQVVFSTTPLGAGSAEVGWVPDVTSSTSFTMDTNPSTTVTSMQPSFSPDGSLIIYRTVDDSPFQCEIKTAETSIGGAVTTLKTISRTTNGLVFMPRFSPDGTKIAYALEGTKTLNVMNADGTGASVVATQTGSWQQGWNFAWLNNSNVLVYQTITASKTVYRKVNADGTGDTLLWTDPNTSFWGMSKRPVTSDDSALLVFARDQSVDPKFSLYSVDMGGGGATLISPTISSYGGTNDFLAFVYGNRVYWAAGNSVSTTTIKSASFDGSGVRTEFDCSSPPAGSSSISWSSGFAGLQNQGE